MSQEVVRYPGDRPSLAAYFGDLTGARVLDVGCGGGGLARHLRLAGAKELVGLEPDAQHAQLARTTMDEVVEAPIETALEKSLLNGPWDFVVLADVLEHLLDPWTVTQQLSELIAPGGRVLISVPNVAHKTVIAQLVKHRDWEYVDTGMFDRTHLRWFGRNTLNGMITDAGLEPIKWGGSIVAGWGPIQYAKVTNDLGHWPLVFVYHFHVVARKPS